MPLPAPRPGLVVSYAYLWHHEHRAGREEGRKNRPCVIVLAVKRTTADAILVRVVPVTHSAPDEPAAAVELPRPVKRHLGLDDERSWVVLDEINEFAWPGFDLRPISPSQDRFEYGFLPPRLFDRLTAVLRDTWRGKPGKVTRRD